MVAAASGIALDPERALWLPGKRLISIPKPAPITITSWSDAREMFRIGDKISFGLDPRIYSITGVGESGLSFDVAGYAQVGAYERKI